MYPRAVRPVFHHPPDAGVSSQVAKHFRHNFFVNASDGLAWLFGESFVASSTILPVFISTLTNSPLIIGLIPAIRDTGWFLPQLFLAPWVERRQRQLPTVIWLGLVERIPYLALSLVAFGMMGFTSQKALVIFLLILVWKSVTSGLVALPWQELISRVIPVSHRGRFSSFTWVAGYLAAILGAAISGFILTHIPYPTNYALCFFLAFLSVMLSLAFLTLNREPSLSNYLPHQQTTTGFFDRIKQILKRSHNFRVFLISRVFSYLGGMALGFIAVYSLQRFGLPDAHAAIFTSFSMVGGTLGFGLSGFVGDRLGHKRVLELSSVFWVVGLLLLLWAPNVHWIYFVFALISFASTWGTLGDFNIVLEFGNENERPLYIGIARTLTGPVLLVAPVLAGGIVGLGGYLLMFGVSLVFAFANLLILTFLVNEPRLVAINPTSPQNDTPHNG
ncbi:MAG: MFS transporter [Chloroflexota bacterium]